MLKSKILCLTTLEAMRTQFPGTYVVGLGVYVGTHLVVAWEFPGMNNSCIIAAVNYARLLVCARMGRWSVRTYLCVCVCVCVCEVERVKV